MDETWDPTTPPADAPDLIGHEGGSIGDDPARPPSPAQEHPESDPPPNSQPLGPVPDMESLIGQ